MAGNPDAMLRELSVQNLALIEDVRVELQPGFCAWTGETGAGKSLLLGALGLLLGERGSSDLLRTGAEELRITGRFELSTDELKREVGTLLDTTLEDSEIILARRLNRTGRSQAYVNDQPVAVATLRQIGSLLVDIHGQRESESLLQPAYQLQLLDSYGQLEGPRQKYLELAARLREQRRQWKTLSAQQQQRQRELALIRFEREELDQAGLEPGEMQDLLKERERLLNAQSLQTLAAQGYGQLYDEDASVIEQLGKLQREAEGWCRLDSRLEEVVSRLKSLSSEVQDLAHTLRDLGSRWESDPERLGEVEHRLHLLRRLESKYRKTIDQLIVYRLSLDEQESQLQQQEENLEGLQKEIGETYAQLKESAAQLSKQRRKVANKLAQQAQKELLDLGMPEARLQAVLEPIPLGDDPAESEIPAWGTDQLELTLAANPGNRPGRCARSPRGASCRGPCWPSRRCWPATIA